MLFNQKLNKTLATIVNLFGQTLSDCLIRIRFLFSLCSASKSQSSKEQPEIGFVCILSFVFVVMIFFNCLHLAMSRFCLSTDIKKWRKTVNFWMFCFDLIVFCLGTLNFNYPRFVFFRSLSTANLGGVALRMWLWSPRRSSSFFVDG